MAGFINRSPDVRDSTRDAGRRLVVHDRDSHDGAAAILSELLFDDGGIDAVAPVAGNEVDLQTEPRGHVAPEHGEVAGLEHQHVVAGRQGIHERRLPRAGAGRGIDHDVSRGLKHALKAVEHLARERREGRATVIDGRLRDGAQDPVRHVCRPRDLKKVTARFHAGQ